MSESGSLDRLTRSWHRGVLAAIGCSICIALGLIPLFMGAFPVFLEPVSSDLHWGLSVFPQMPLLIGVTTAVAGPIVGRQLDRHGVRRLLPCGLALWCLGFFGLSLVSGSIAEMYLIAIVIGIGATISGPITYARVINGWFDRNRGLALGLVLSASPAIATAVAVQLCQRSIDVEGWRNTVRMLAIVAASVTIPTALLLVREAPVRNTDGAPLEAAEGLASGRALRSRDFLLLIATSSLAVGALMGTTAHFLAWMAERGIPKQVGTSALSLYSLAGPLGPLVGGYLVDRLESPRIVAVFFTLPLIGIYLLMYGSRAAIIPGMIALGLAFSSINGFVPYLVSRYFGMRSISEILGVTFAALTVAMGLGPVLIGIGRDHFGGYRWPMAIAAGLATLTLAGALCFGPYRYRAAKSAP